MPRSLGWRLYQDYLMGSRLSEYEAVLRCALQEGYRILSVERWAAERATGCPDQGSRILVLRHDVDTDPVTAFRLAEINARLAIQTSFYFRLRTFDPTSVAAVAASGGHVGYHYEEIADFAKEHHLRRAEQVAEFMPAIRQRFLDNIRRLRTISRLPLKVVCSHGDWMNRILGVSNYEILRDPAFRALADVEREVYDLDFMESMPEKWSDAALPARWFPPQGPQEMFSQGRGPVHLLIHPREWHSSWRCNTRENWIRLREHLAFRRNAGT